MSSYPDPNIFGPAGEGGLCTLDPKTGAAPASRLRDARSAHKLYQDFRRADSDSAWGRMQCQQMVDGEAPYNQDQLDALGQGYRFNLNFGQAAAEEESALSAYHDIINSVSELVWVSMNTRTSDEDLSDKEHVINEEFTRMLKKWPQFEFRVQRLAKQFVDHGVGLAYFPDDLDFRFDSAGLRDFLFPRSTQANEEDIEMAFCMKKIPVHRLWKYIEDPEQAEKSLWNVQAVRETILRASRQKWAHHGIGQLKWEEFEAEIKNNDLFIGWAKAALVNINHIWVSEFNGTVSHFIADETGQADEFLFAQFGRFGSVGDCFVVFPYGTGNDGAIHSIRGLLYKIFPHVQAENRLRNTVLDSTVMSATLLLQTGDADDHSAFSPIHIGPFMVLQGETRFAEKQFPNVAKDVLPVIRDMEEQRANNVGSYRPQALSPNGNERTKFEVQAELQTQSTLSTAQMNLFYGPWERLLTQVFYRARDGRYREDSPGGKLVMEFRRRCLARGVTMEDLKAVYDVVAVRAVGNGSAGMRAVAIDELKEMIPMMDEVGRNKALRAQIASRLGWQAADEYFPRVTQRVRPVADLKIAMMEDSMFQLGQNQQVTIGDNHFIHAQQHVQTLTQQSQALEQGQADPVQVVKYYRLAIPHIEQHLQEVQQDPSRQQAYAGLAKQFTSMLNFATRAEQKVTASMQQQQQDAQQAQQQSPQDPKLQAELARIQFQLKSQEELHQQKMQHRQQDWQQRMALRDLSDAHKLTLARQQQEGQIPGADSSQSDPYLNKVTGNN